MYAYACFLHAHAYSKYAYAYNWAAYVGPMYMHAYSCLETLIQPFYLCFFILLTPYASVLPCFHAYKSLPFMFVCCLSFTC